MTGTILSHIDGVPTVAEDIGVFRQREPYPGGHSFRIVFSGRQPRRLFKKFSNGRIEHPDDGTVSSLLFFATAILLNLKSTEGREKFVLNTVESAEFSDEEVALTGICSEILPSR